MKNRKFSPLDFAMAALAGASVAFAVFALPDWRFQQAVALSGLPLILPAAQPPLGETARLLVAAVAGAFAFGLAWLVLRSIGEKPATAPKQRFQPVELDIAPKIRRADAHPDAPARRPIFAELDLGEPIEPEAEREPIFTADAQEEEEQPVAQVPNASFTPAEEPEEAELLELTEEQPARAFEQDSIPHLMQRLELGLLRREGKAQVAETADPVWAAKPAPAQQAQMDERLRGAIADLQRLARSS